MCYTSSKCVCVFSSSEQINLYSQNPHKHSRPPHSFSLSLFLSHTLFLLVIRMFSCFTVSISYLGPLKNKKRVRERLTSICLISLDFLTFLLWDTLRITNSPLDVFVKMCPCAQNTFLYIHKKIQAFLHYRFSIMYFCLKSFGNNDVTESWKQELLTK